MQSGSRLRLRITVDYGDSAFNFDYGDSAFNLITITVTVHLI